MVNYRIAYCQVVPMVRQVPHEGNTENFVINRGGTYLINRIATTVSMTMIYSGAFRVRFV